MNFTIGADPEVFLKNVKAPGSVFVSAEGKIGGTKKEPLQVPRLPAGFCVQEDNVAAEFNIPPATSADEFAKNIETMVRYLEEKAKAIGLIVAITPSARFDPEQLKSEQAAAFGCDADFNAWNGKQNPKPVCDDPQLRTCGGHVAVGTNLSTVMCVRAEDLLLGVPSVIMDTDQRRRLLYGKAGCYRETSFGHEYRVLSNFWIVNPLRVKWVYGQVKRALELVQASVTMGIDEDVFLDGDREMIEKAINMGDLTAVHELDKKYDLVSSLRSIYPE